MLVLSRTDIQSLIDFDAVRDAVADALREVSTGRASMPPRIAAHVPDRGLLAAMPAYLPDAGALAVKVVSLFPGNAGTHVPTHQAVILVFDADVEPADRYEDACRDADIVCATTHAATPVVRREFLRPGTHVTSVGYNAEGREVDSATVVDAIVVVESREAVFAAPPSGSNDLRIPIQEGLIGPQHIHAEVGELLAGVHPGRTTPHEITLYKSVGIAAQDVATAALVMAAAKRAGIGADVEV